jgi:chromosome partitioning protein
LNQTTFADKKMPRGGKRVGSGSKKKPPDDLKVRMVFHLDSDVSKLIKESSVTSYSQFVNNILKKMGTSQSPQAKIISLVNQAGGVAKTTMTMNIGYHLAKLGHRILLIDIDPQASLTTFMGLESHDLSHTIANSLSDENFDLPIYSGLHGMDLVPSNLDLSSIELQLVSMMAREMLLKKVLAKHLTSYDFILIDCPPNLGILNVIALTASTHVLVPVQTQYKAFKGVESLLDTIQKIKAQINPTLKIGGFMPTMHTGASQNIFILDALRTNLEAIAPIFPEISRATAFADASMHHQPLSVYSQSHPSIEALMFAARLVEALDDAPATDLIFAEIEESKKHKEEESKASAKLTSTGKGVKNNG